MLAYQPRARRAADPVAEAVAERLRLDQELLQALAAAVAANEGAQRRFRTAVLLRLSRIETMVQMIHGAQIVEADGPKPRSEDQIKEHAKAAEEYIAEHSRALLLRMARFVYEEPTAPGARPNTGRKGSA